MSSKNLPNSEKIHHSTNHTVDRRDNETGFNSLEERPTTSIAGWYLKVCSINVTNL